MGRRVAGILLLAGILVLVHALSAAALPRGVPIHAPAAATDPQPALPEPSRASWPFPDAFSRTSGTGRSAGGAELWSDFVFDDHGAAIPAAVPLEPLEASSILAFWQGDYGYTNPAAKNDGADIFRAGVAVDRSNTYWRVDWNTLADPSTPIAEWTFDTDDNAATGASAWPAGAGVRSPGIDRALLVSSRGAWLIDPATGRRVDVRAHGGAVTVDRRSQAFIVRVPRSLLPVSGAWRLRLAAGLANPAGDGFAPATLVGGGPVPPGYPNVYNVAFRAVAQEPPIYTDGLTDALEAALGKLIQATPVLGSTYGLDGQERTITGNFWSEDDQADTLNSGEVSKFSLVVDWSDLQRRMWSPEPLPHGYSVRWYVSRFRLGGGLATGEALQSSPSSSYNEIPQILSRVQPYSVYVPQDYSPRRPAALTWTLHSLETSYGQYAGLDPRLIGQLCEQRSSICVSPEGLGPSGDWAGMAEADLWQVWRAVAGTYNIDPDRTVLSGYSMGGEASNTLASEHPDAFAGGLVLDGSTFAPIPMSNLRWVPYVIDNTIADELDPTTDAVKEADQFDASGQRYTLLLHSGGDHLTFAIEDRFDDAVAALGEPVRAGEPGKFAYAWAPSYDNSTQGIGATGVYWLDDLSARDAKAASASVGADDEALPQPAINATRRPLSPVSSPTPGFERSLSWQLGAAPATRALASLQLQNVAAVAINTTLARLHRGTLIVRTDGPLIVTFEHLRAGTPIEEGSRRVGRATRRGTARVRVGQGTHTLAISSPARSAAAAPLSPAGPTVERRRSRDRK